MPPKVKVTKEDIIKTALDIVRSRGVDAINARSIASELGCSTQPIFSNFSGMEELEEAVVASAREVYFSFLQREVESGKYPEYKAFGMGYIRFAKEEKELFKLLFMCDRQGKGLEAGTDFEKSVEYIVMANGISKDEAELMHLEMWVCVHGIATMVATSFLEFSTEVISNMLTDVYQGLRSSHAREEK